MGAENSVICDFWPKIAILEVYAPYHVQGPCAIAKTISHDVWTTFGVKTFRGAERTYRCIFCLRKFLLKQLILGEIAIFISFCDKVVQIGLWGQIWAIFAWAQLVECQSLTGDKGMINILIKKTTQKFWKKGLGTGINFAPIWHNWNILVAGSAVKIENFWVLVQCLKCAYRMQILSLGPFWRVSRS